MVKRAKLSNTQKFIIGVICLSMFAVLSAVLSTILLSPERTTKELISNITSDYYENYYYAKILEANPSATPEKLEEILGKYEKSGLAAIPLTELLLYDNQKNADAELKIGQYCDTNRTFIKIYPDPPYKRNSYHVEYTYSGNF